MPMPLPTKSRSEFTFCGQGHVPGARRTTTMMIIDVKEYMKNRSTLGFGPFRLLFVGLGLLLLSACTVSQKNSPSSPTIGADSPDSPESVSGSGGDPSAVVNPTSQIGTAVRPHALVLSIDFSADSREAAFLCEDGDVIWLGLPQGDEVERTELMTRCQLPFELLKGRRFVVGVEGGLRVHDSESGADVNIRLEGEALDFVIIDEIEKRIGIPYADGRVGVWDLTNGTLLRRFDGLEGDQQFRVHSGPGFSVVYTIGADVLRLRELEEFGRDVTLSFDRDPDSPVVVSGDGSSIASRHPEGFVEVRGLPAGRVQSRVRVDPSVQVEYALAPDGSVLALASEGSGIDLWDTLTGERLEHLNARVTARVGVEFSPDGFLIAWVQAGSGEPQVWSPALGALEWTESGPELNADARRVCSNLALAVRFYKAMTPYADALVRMESGDFDGARQSLLFARSWFPAYPGLPAAIARVDELRQTQSRESALNAQLEEFEQRGDYAASLAALDEFIQRYPSHRDFGQQEYAEQLRSMLKHFHMAESYRDSQRFADAVTEFEKAVEVFPAVASHYPQFEILREKLLLSLPRIGVESFDAGDFATVRDTYLDLKKLRLLTNSEILRLGKAQQGLGSLPEAREVFDSVEEESDEYGEARWRIAQIAREQGELENARAELESARELLPQNSALENEYAAVALELGEPELAIEAYQRIGEWEADNPSPFLAIADLELTRENVDAAVEALELAYGRSSDLRLLLRIGEVWDKADAKDKAVAAYVRLMQDLAPVEPTAEATRLATDVRLRLENLGYVEERGAWVPKERFMAKQGWVQFDGAWMRPDEAQLRRIVQGFEDEGDRPLRVKTDAFYSDEAAAKRVVEGMNRREVIQAWGYFEDQNLYEVPDTELTYEQLLYPDGRRVYMRGGVVCFWSE